MDNGHEELTKAMMQSSFRFEGMLSGKGAEIRELSKPTYGVELLDARMLFIGILFELFALESGKPGFTNPSISERILLTCIFAQGVSFTEALILEGQYIKASAAMKQDYEILVRIRALREGEAKTNEMPNIKLHAPEGSQRIYGQLNDIAHVAKEGLLLDLVMRIAKVSGISPLPEFNATTSRSLYEVHLFLLAQVAKEAFLLMLEIYPNGRQKEMDILRRFYLVALENLKKAGFRVEGD